MLVLGTHVIQHGRKDERNETTKICRRGLEIDESKGATAISRVLRGAGRVRGGVSTTRANKQEAAGDPATGELPRLVSLSASSDPKPSQTLDLFTLACCHTRKLFYTTGGSVRLELLAK